MTIRRVLLQLLAATLLLLWCAVPAHAAEQADMEITQTGSPNPAPVGGQLTWTILVSNLGPGTAVNVEVNGNFNQYGPTTEFVSLAISSGTCTHATSTYNCQIGTVAAGATVTPHAGRHRAQWQLSGERGGREHGVERSRLEQQPLGR